MINDELLLKVEKPARYIGNEINVVMKDVNEIDVRFCFAFPDVYEVGMSHLGMQILYYFLNRRSDVFCERVFSPWVDMEELLLEKDLPLCSLETDTPLKEFDFLGFTLQYEMSYTNILQILDLGKIPLFAKDRDESFPLVIAGGPCAYNPEPISDFIDFFYIGEGEKYLDEIMDKYKVHKQKGLNKDEFLKDIVKLDGIYVPKFYDVTYKENGEIKSFTKNVEEAPDIVKRVVISDLTDVFYPEKMLVPLIETVHDRATLEVFRGCVRGCRFCQAGFTYRPQREKSPEALIQSAKCLVQNSGHEELSLVSLSTGDYSKFPELANGLLDEFEDKRVNIALPSLRIDGISIDIINKIQRERKSSLTFAPEAGTQRMRDVINKGIDEQEILDGARLSFENGFNKIKLYFMVGLPTETLEDITGIGELVDKIVHEYYKLDKSLRTRPVSITMSTSNFVPKPFTPFQWEPQDENSSFMEKQALLKRSFRSKQVRYNYHQGDISVLEGVIARGDRRVSAVILDAYKNGARFDGWTEHFKKDVWDNAFINTNIDRYFYTTRKRDVEEILPWDFIDIGVKKEFLISEKNKAYAEIVTPDCNTKCSNCGAMKFEGGVCYKK